MESFGTVGRYQLLKPIAQGGMAEIFLARQEGPAGFGKTVVVKRILSHLSGDEGFVQMFLDEARLAALLSHPNVVQIFDFGEDAGSYYIAMEYLAGEDLSSIIRQAKARGRPVPAQIAALICSHACEGLGYAHTLPGEDGEPLGIVHRDVSPSNIFVTYQGVVKILDFGIAKAEGKNVKTEAGTVKGKFMYMSPEQARGRQIDGRSDIFALGAVMYELLTGVRLFQRENQLATLMAVTEQPIPSPREHRPDLLPEIEDVIMKALERDVNARFTSAQNMRESLDEFLAMRTYAPSHVQLRQYLIDLFGQEHVAERSRPPVTHPGGTPPGGPAIRAARTPAPSAAPQEGAAPTATVGAPAPQPPPVATEAAPPAAPSGGLEGLATQVGVSPVEAARPARAAARPRPPEGGPRDPDPGSPPARRPRSFYAMVGAGGVVALATIVGVIWYAEGAAERAAREARPVDAAVRSPHRDPHRIAPPTGPPAGGSGAIAADTDPPPPVRDPAVPADADPTAPDPGEAPAASPEDPPAVAAADPPPRRPPPEPKVAEEPPAPDPPPRRRPRRRPPPPPEPEPEAEVREPVVTKQPTRPPPRPPPAPPPEPAGEAAQGTLMVNCIPWCRIYVNDRDTGRTSPARDIRLRAGRHQLKLVHPPTGAERYEDVEIQAGEETVAVIRF